MGTEITNLGAGMYILFGDLILGNLLFANLFLSTQYTKYYKNEINFSHLKSFLFTQNLVIHNKVKLIS